MKTTRFLAPPKPKTSLLSERDVWVIFAFAVIAGCVVGGLLGVWLAGVVK